MILCLAKIQVKRGSASLLKEETGIIGVLRSRQQKQHFKLTTIVAARLPRAT